MYVIESALSCLTTPPCNEFRYSHFQTRGGGKYNCALLTHTLLAHQTFDYATNVWQARLPTHTVSTMLIFHSHSNPSILYQALYRFCGCLSHTMLSELDNMQHWNDNRWKWRHCCTLVPKLLLMSAFAITGSIPHTHTTDCTLARNDSPVGIPDTCIYV